MTVREMTTKTRGRMKRAVEGMKGDLQQHMLLIPLNSFSGKESHAKRDMTAKKREAESK